MASRNKLKFALTTLCFGFVAYLAYSYAMIVSMNSAVTNGDIVSIRSCYGRLTKLSWYLGMNPLEKAIAVNKKEAFSFLLELGANPHYSSSERMPIIHRTCLMSDSFWLREVLRFGADPNLLWETSRTRRPNRPMFMAMRYDNFHLVPILVEAGASLTEQILIHEGSDYTPIGYAANSGPEAVETVLFFLDRGVMPPKDQRSSSLGIFVQDTASSSWRHPITAWFDRHGMDLRRAYWSGTEWIIPTYSPVN